MIRNWNSTTASPVRGMALRSGIPTLFSGEPVQVMPHAGSGRVLHVDDMIIAAARRWLLKEFVPLIEKDFVCTWSITSEEGESVDSGLLLRNLN